MKKYVLLALITCACGSAPPREQAGGQRPEPPVVWFVGDSHTELAVEPHGLRFEAYLAAPDADFLGSRRDGGWEDAQHDGLPGAKVASRVELVRKAFQGATVVHLLVGTNDFRERDYSAEDYAAGVREILSVIEERSPSTQIVVGSPPLIDPGKDPEAAVRALEASEEILPAVVGGFSRATFVDYHAVLSRKHLIEDGFHLTANGNRILSEVAMSVLGPMLGVQ